MCFSCGVSKYAFNIKMKLQAVISVGAQLAGQHVTSFYIFFLTSAERSLTFPFLSVVVIFACGHELLDLIDCKVSAVAGERQLISFCVTAYIRRITSERLHSGQEAPTAMISATFMTSIQHRNINISHSAHLFSHNFLLLKIHMKHLNCEALTLYFGQHCEHKNGGNMLTVKIMCHWNNPLLF